MTDFNLFQFTEIEATQTVGSANYSLLLIECSIERKFLSIFLLGKKSYLFYNNYQEVYLNQVCNFHHSQTDVVYFNQFFFFVNVITMKFTEVVAFSCKFNSFYKLVFG